MANRKTPGRNETPGLLLTTVKTVVAELHPGQNLMARVSLDASLDRDLAFDSLGRMELFLRLERTFGVPLPESLFSSAETPRDLLAAIMGREGSSHYGESSAPISEEGGAAEPAPPSVQTLIEALEWHVKAHPNRLTIRFYADEGEGETLTYRDLWQGAASVAAGLQRHNLRYGESVAIMLATGKEYFFSLSTNFLTRRKTSRSSCSSNGGKDWVDLLSRSE